MIKRVILSVIALASSIMGMNARVPSEHRTRLTEDWMFLKGDLGSIWEAVRPCKPGSSEAVPIWTPVTLPHCFNSRDAVDPDENYYQGPGWYKTQLEINQPYDGGRILLDFDGAGQKTDVYVYTTLVASHVGGYDEWTADITEAVEAFRKTEECRDRFKGKIPISIRCDNSRDTEMIPSDLADFNLYGGLYRYVNLVYVPSAYIERLKITPVVDGSLKNGTLSIDGIFINEGDIRTSEAKIKITSPDGKVVADEIKEISPLGECRLMNITLLRPMLWSTDNPRLYSCEVTLKLNGQEQKAVVRFGFRNCEFIDHGPFKLNGTRLLLRGTHRHEDHAGVGAAMTEELMNEEMRMIKDMGVNFIRLAHYQQSDIILSLCDELGILVWEEIPWCRGGLGGEMYQEQARQMLRNMIYSHYNHPSVIIWGLGNENDWPNDFPEFDQGKIRSFMKELNDLAHDLDGRRKTAIRRCDFCKDIVDVYSPSIWAGWYRGLYTDYKSVSYSEMQKVRHFLHVEWGGDSHAGRHMENTFTGIQDMSSGSADERAGDASLTGGNARMSRDGDWSESYMVRLVDWHLKEQETMDWLTGTAFWPFKDFSTPVRPENPIPYVNQKGAVCRDLTPKEIYYVFQSYWTKKPMMHIYGHTWPIRWGKENEKKEILVYSNCGSVELFVNGESQGIKKRDSHDFPAAGLRWNCPLKSGENTVIAVSHDSKAGPVSDTINFSYETRQWGQPSRLSTNITRCGEGIVQLEVQLTDSEGVPCLDSKDWIYFGLAGDGKLIDDQGTSKGSRKLQAYNGRAIIRIETKHGKSLASAGSSAYGVKTVFVPITD